MNKDFINSVQHAVEQSLRWSEQGWPVTFGIRKVVVSSLRQALELPENEACRDDAVHYWEQVDQLGKETAEWGRKAAEHLTGNDLQVAEDALYYARFLERPIVQYTRTWKPVHLQIRKELIKSSQK